MAATLAQIAAGRAGWEALSAEEKARREAGFAAGLRAQQMVIDEEAREVAGRSARSAASAVEASPIATTETQRPSAVFEPRFVRPRR